MIGLLLKIPYVKQIGIGILIAASLYMWYLTSQNKSLLVKNERYRIELKGWEVSYSSLLKEMQASEKLLRERRKFLARLTEEKKTLKMIVNRAKEDNPNVKKWFNTRIHDDVLLLRKRLRVQRAQRAKDP